MAAWGAAKGKIKHLRLISLWQTTVSARGVLYWFKHMAGNIPCSNVARTCNLQGRKRGGRTSELKGDATWGTWFFSFQVNSFEKKDFFMQEKRSANPPTFFVSVPPTQSPCQSISRLFRNARLLSEVTRWASHSYYSHSAETPCKITYLQWNCSSDC